MAFLSTNNKKKKIVLNTLLLIAIIAVCFVLFLYPFLGRILWMTGLVSGPYDHPGSVWISEEPEIVLQISQSRSTADSICYVFADEKRIPAIILVQPDIEDVFIMSKAKRDDLLTGKLISCTKDEVTFSVSEDYLYSGKYQTITLIRQK